MDGIYLIFIIDSFFRPDERSVWSTSSMSGTDEAQKFHALANDNAVAVAATTASLRPPRERVVPPGAKSWSRVLPSLQQVCSSKPTSHDGRRCDHANQSTQNNDANHVMEGPQSLSALHCWSLHA
jgi:hypothetical protein